MQPLGDFCRTQRRRLLIPQTQRIINQNEITKSRIKMSKGHDEALLSAGNLIIKHEHSKEINLNFMRDQDNSN